jgi:hypothetical protein
MKKTNNTWLIPFLLVGFAYLFSITSCKKSESTNTPAGPVPVLETSVVTDIKGSKATCGGIIGSDNGSTITARGVCWSKGSSPTISNDKTMDGAGAGYFISTVSKLEPKTTYFLRAYATNGNGTGYGSTMSFTTTDLTVLDDYQGGVIVYFLAPGDNGYISGQKHGFIAAPSDQSTGIAWIIGNNYQLTYTSTELGTGYSNTNSIVDRQGLGNYAARICYDLELNGYFDWYLPSLEELTKLQDFLLNDNSNDRAYWCSSENGTTSAWCVSLGSSYISLKGELMYVRAIRTF